MVKTPVTRTAAGRPTTERAGGDVILVGRDLESAGRSDAIRHTLDYGQIYQVVEAAAGERERKLVESLARDIAEAILSRFTADWVTVTVRKAKPIAGVLDWAGVRITRSR